MESYIRIRIVINEYSYYMAEPNRYTCSCIVQSTLPLLVKGVPYNVLIREDLLLQTLWTMKQHNRVCVAGAYFRFVSRLLQYNLNLTNAALSLGFFPLSFNLCHIFCAD